MQENEKQKRAKMILLVANSGKKRILQELLCPTVSQLKVFQFSRLMHMYLSKQA